ncbi:MAG: NAD+ synthase [Pseudanabaena sp. ELA607]
MSYSINIGIAQCNPIIGDLVGNAWQIRQAVIELVTKGAKLIITPELSLCGYPPRDLLLDDGFIKEMAEALERLAEDIYHELQDIMLPSLAQNVTVLVGVVTVNLAADQAGGKPLFNSVALLQGGKIKQFFHKRLLPTYDVFDEDRYFEPGSGSTFFNLGGWILDVHSVITSEQNPVGVKSKSKMQSLGVVEKVKTLRVGVTICEDVWNDARFWGKSSYANDPVQDLVAQEVDLLINLSASPYAVGKQQLREAMLRHSAVAHGLPLVYVNQVGGNDDLIFDGRSMVWDGQGNLLLRGAAFESANYVIQVDLPTVALTSPLNQSILENALVAPKPESDNAEIFAALVLGVKDYVRKCGFKQVILGLSGGIDSALVAAIAAEALGSRNVLGILMPSPYSSDHSITDALLLAEYINIETTTIPIEPMMQAFDQSLTDLFAGRGNDITEENLQSRIRGSILMAVSNKFGYLLLSTGNKSEMSVGYCTLYGDMNGGLAVIADVFKTRVYDLCRWLNETTIPLKIKPSPDQVIIPENIIAKAPSAELKPDQTDQDSLPPYEILDDILHQLINQRLSAATLMKQGYDKDIVKRVISLIKIAEFKRRQAAPGLKITARAFGSGWRMPIAYRRSY